MRCYALLAAQLKISCSIIPPNTQYAVYCPEDSIIVRTHFLATSTLEETTTAYIRHCVAINLGEDTGQQLATILLRRMTAFYHHALVHGEPSLSDMGK